MAPEPLLPHETPAFQNAAEYVVAITFTVAGGARARTADGRAEGVAERLANAAARAAGVVKVAAVTGPASGDGTMLVPRRVHFSAANTGHANTGDPHKLDRYLDPEHERALASLKAANAAYRARQEADRARRLESAARTPTGSACPANAGRASASTAGPTTSPRASSPPAGPAGSPCRRACAARPRPQASPACTTATSPSSSSTATPRRCSSWPRRSGAVGGHDPRRPRPTSLSRASGSSAMQDRRRHAEAPATRRNP